MRSLLYALPFLVVMMACHKSDPPLPAPVSGDRIITFTVMDTISHQPVDSASVGLTYGNAYSQSCFTASNGKASFSIPAGYVINEVAIIKTGYCKIDLIYNSASIASAQTVTLARQAYLRIHVENLAPISGSDFVEISYPDPSLNQSTPDIFHGAVNTTYISKPAYAGNLGILVSLYSGSTFISSSNVYIYAIAGDTTDVTVNF